MQLLNTAEAASLLGVSPGRVKQFVSDGRLIPERRHPYIFTLDALRKLMEQWEPGKSGRPRNAPPVDVTAVAAQVPVA